MNLSSRSVANEMPGTVLSSECRGIFCTLKQCFSRIYIFSTSTSLLSALLPTLAQNPSHPFSYHHQLPLKSLATLTAIIHPGTPTHRKTNQAKICLIGSSLLILTTPNITSYYTVPPETALPLISP